MSLRPPIGSEALAQEVQRLNDEYQALANRMIANRSRINTLAPISYLANELLVHVFSFLTPSRSSDIQHFNLSLRSEVSRTRQAWLNWIHVTHVCGHWRHIALEDPSLWTVVYCGLGSEWMNLMLSRSKALPIDVSFEYKHRVYEPGSDLNFNLSRILRIAEHQTHTRILKVRAQLAGPNFNFRWMLARFNGVLPILETLELHGDSRYEAIEVVRMPEGHFHSMPTLKELVLYNIIPSWMPQALPSLSNLVKFDFTLPDVRDHGTFLDSEFLPARHQLSRSQLLPNMPQLLDILETMPLLESLSFRDTLPTISVDPLIQQTRVVSLPRLSFLSLSGPIRDCTSFAKCLDFSPTTYICLDDDNPDENEDDEDYPPIGHILERHLARQNSVSRKIDQVEFIIMGGFLTLRISAVSQRIFNVDVLFLHTEAGLDFLGRAFAAMPICANASFRLRFEWATGNMISPDAFESVFNQPSLAAILTVEINGDTLHPLCPALTNAFVRDPEYDPPPSLRAFNVFPGLQTVIFNNLNFQKMQQSQMVELRDEIINAIRTRERRGQPLKHVLFRYPTFVPLEWMQSIKVLFPDIIRW
ncbi:hypothetical protein EVG20_g9217 [Dentipellis fragilis]|uniref:F-box domain-containing protein n=1 Tax=Dentipellis fragilis TaxID=205917 RepID=A0A4Y9Y1V0_9AGAM|nr:hypothetical protein EVG20_g9217 [Dentipellis fragilis]